MRGRKAQRRLLRVPAADGKPEVYERTVAKRWRIHEAIWRDGAIAGRKIARNARSGDALVLCTAHGGWIMTSPDVSADERSPRHHTRAMQQRLQQEIDHLRADIAKVDEPQLKAMFETSAEVLGGLMSAFRDYERKNEAAWEPSRH
jgi:hypothetical protein